MACKTDPEGDCMETTKGKLWRLFETILQSCAAEFFGTLIYVFIAVMVSTGIKGIGIIHSDHLSMIVPVALCTGFTVAALMSAFTKVSGAHFNPAVSIAVCVAGGMQPALLPFYIFMQLLGGIVGASVPLVVTSDEQLEIILTNAPVELAVSPIRAILCESMLTMVVVFVMLLTTVDEKTKTHSGPVAVGFTYVVGALAGMRTTGGCINPAHSFGSAVVLSLYTQNVWPYQYVFWVGPVLSGVVTALLYRYVLFRQNYTCPNETCKYTHLKTNGDQNEHD